MSSINLIQEAIRRYGRTVSLKIGEENYRYTACVLPRLFRSRTDEPDLFSISGRHDPRFAVYYGPLSDGGELLEAGCVLQCEKEIYRVQVVQDYYLGTQPVYRWAVLARMDGGELDGSF